MRRSSLINSIAAVGVSLTMAGCSTASSLDTSSLKSARLSSDAADILNQSVASMAVFGVKADAGSTSTPIGAHDFCKKSNNCPSLLVLAKVFHSSPSTIPTQAQLTALSTKVNGQYAPALDKEIYGEDERWTYPSDKADCEDYALVKRKELLQMGVMPERLSMAVVKQKNGDGHAILLVEGSDDIYVLDNLTDKARTFSEAANDYTFVKWSSTLKKWHPFDTPIVTPPVTATP